MNKSKLVFVAATLLASATTVNAATLVHSYQFAGNLNDSVGTLAITANGGTVGAGSYSFDANQGLTLANALTSGASYSIALNFNFTTLGGWQKIVDFSDRASDVGFYTLGSHLNSFPVVDGTTNLTAGQNIEVVITRDASTDQFTAYLNGSQELTFTDSSFGAVFSATNNVMHFFEDDFATGIGEAAAGVVNSIRIWDGALTANEVSNINAVPVPGSVWLFGSALAGLMSATRKQKS